MKKFMKQFGILSLALAVSTTMLPLQNAEAKANTCIKGLRSLVKGQEYHYDIDGDGKKDTIYWAVKGGSGSKETLSVYVNEKEIYTIKDTLAEERRVSFCNIDNKDDFVEILVEEAVINRAMKSCAFLRYNKGKVSTLFRSDGTEKIERYGVDVFANWTVKGNGIVIQKNSTCFSTYTTGCIELQVPLKLKDGKLVYATKNQYILNHINQSTLGKYNYKAGNEIKVYKDARIKSGTAFTLKKGQRFYASKLRVLKWEKDENGYYTGTKFFLQIKTKDGKTGWVYIPSVTNQAQDFTGGGSVYLPAWN